MKKLLIMSLALAMSLSLVACSNDTANEELVDEENVTEVGEEITGDSILELCNLTEDDIKRNGASIDVLSETSESYSATVTCGDNSFEQFEAYVNALAQICKDSSLDRKLYQDEITWNEAEINLEAGSINICQFIYKLSGHVVYVTIGQGANESNDFSLLIQRY